MDPHRLVLSHPRSPENKEQFEAQLISDWETETADVLSQERTFRVAPFEITQNRNCIALWKFMYLQRQQGVLFEPPPFNFSDLPILCQRLIISSVDNGTFSNCQLVNKQMNAVCDSVSKERRFQVEELTVGIVDENLHVFNKKKDFLPKIFRTFIFAKEICIENGLFDQKQEFQETTVKMFLKTTSHIRCRSLWIGNISGTVILEQRLLILRQMCENFRPIYISGFDIGNILHSISPQLDGVTASIQNDEDFLSIRAKKIKLFQTKISDLAMNTMLKEWKSGKRDFKKMEISLSDGRTPVENHVLLGIEVIRNPYGKLIIQRESDEERAIVRISWKHLVFRTIEKR